MINEYGSQFEYVAPSLHPNGYLPKGDDTSYLGSGRECLLMVGKKCIEMGVKKIFMPSLCCPAMVQPFSQLGFNITYYDITEELKIDIADVQNKLVDNSLLLIMNYYGIHACSVHDLTLLKKTKSNVFFVQDCTQHYFTKSLYNADMDFYIASIRKWMSIPDGAYLNSSIPLVFEKYAISEYSRLWYEAMKLKADYLKSGYKFIKEVYRAKFAECAKILKGEVKPSEMSKKALELFYCHDIDKLINQRNSNFNYLLNKLKGKVDDVILKYNVEQECPLCFVIIVEERDKVQKLLASKNIYTQVLWPIPEDAKKSDFSVWFSNHMLAVPCDQRYDEEDMEYIFNNLIEFLN